MTSPRRALWIVALAPVIPQFLGSTFNIWYNVAVVDPILITPELKQRFIQTCIAYNLLAYSIAVFVWLRLVLSLRPALQRLYEGEEMEEPLMERMQCHVVNLPWWGALVSGAGWLLCIPVFLIALAHTGHGLDQLLWWHLPISFLVSAVISVTHSFFLIELASHRQLFPAVFKDARADRVRGGMCLTLRGRGFLWAVSAGICPIGSLLLLSFAPPAPETNPAWFAVFVGTVGISFGLCTALMISRLVAEPIDHLRTAAQAIAEGRLDVQIPLRRADEFGLLIEEFNRMIRELRDKERLRQMFGRHVGRRTAVQILARDPGLSGVEQVITVMFVDIRSFTQRSACCGATEIVSVLNEFLQVMVEVVEEHHRGMINKFLGDGFIALFGVEDSASRHADDAMLAAIGMLGALEKLNASFQERGRERLEIGIGLHTGPAIVGSIGSPARLEFTAIGSTVNLASRVEGLTKQLGVPLLITEDTRDHLTADLQIRELPPQKVKGLEEPVRVFCVEAEIPEAV